MLQKKLDLAGILSNIRRAQVFFIDEIHRLLPDVEEMLYSALEDFRVDILVGTGPGARTHSLPMPKFTAIGATTRQGLVSAPLRGRFGLVLRLDPYEVAELHGHRGALGAAARTWRSKRRGAEEIARRSRGTPRIANRLLRRVRDYAQVRADGRITRTVAQKALDLLEVDRFGLDEIDQKIMLTVLEKYRGGPVGVNTIAASISEEAETIEEVYEPYLIQLGFLDRTPRGRVATERAYEYFKVKRELRRRRAAGLVLKTVSISSLGSNIGRPRGTSAAGAWSDWRRTMCACCKSRGFTKPSRWDYTEQALVSEPGGGSRDRAVPDAVAGPHRPRRAGTGARAHGAATGRGPSISTSCFTGSVVESTRLEIPHPRIGERRFVLAPLAELAPDLRHPVTQRSVRQMLESAPPAAVRLLHEHH